MWQLTYSNQLLRKWNLAVDCLRSFLKAVESLHHHFQPRFFSIYAVLYSAQRENSNNKTRVEAIKIFDSFEKVAVVPFMSMNILKQILGSKYAEIWHFKTYSQRFWILKKSNRRNGLIFGQWGIRLDKLWNVVEIPVKKLKKKEQ